LAIKKSQKLQLQKATCNTNIIMFCWSRQT